MNNTPLRATLGWFIVSRLKDTLSWPITPVDNRWRTRRSKEVSFRRIRASSPRSKPNHPDELRGDFSSIPGVSRLHPSPLRYQLRRDERVLPQKRRGEKIDNYT